MSYAILLVKLTIASQPVISQKLSLIECQLTSGTLRSNSLAKAFCVFNPFSSPRDANVPALQKMTNEELEILFLLIF